MAYRQVTNNTKPLSGRGLSPSGRSRLNTGSELSRVRTASPARDRLDIDTPKPRHGSSPGIGVGVTNTNQSKRTELDPSDPSTWTSRHIPPVETRPRELSEPVVQPGLPKIQVDSKEDMENTETTSTSSIPSGTIQTEVSSAPGLKLSSSRSPPSQRPITDSPSSPSSFHLSPTSPKHRHPGTSGPIEFTSRRLSDQSGSFSTVNSDGEYLGRVMKDQTGDDEAVEDSSDEKRSVSSFEDPDSPVAERGRQRMKSENSDEPSEQDKEIDPKHDDDPHKKHPTLRDVDVGAPTHSGKFSEAKSKVHPHSNFDRVTSPTGPPAAGGDDDDIQKAKNLALRVSPVDDKIVDRHVKMLIRGEWAKFQDHEGEMAENRHEPRLYLACSDLSQEASYVLEWTIGTLLKDGDTILVINAIGDEHASKQKDVEAEPSLEVRVESAKAAEEATEAMYTLTRQTSNMAESAEPAPVKRLKAPEPKVSPSGSRDGRRPGKKAEERLHAVEVLQTDFLKYVRKTSLQVRCMIEVIHCRSPRHLIVNAIDELEPTLVVVGTRGQGTVRNVMMGSFSNYLVTKSSVPVMVARKRLKKARHAKVSSGQIRMTNNLTPFGMSGRKSLTQARID